MLTSEASNQNPISILITGASSGIGEALAKAYAMPGKNLFLLGRNKERLTAVADVCRKSGAYVKVAIVDVKNAAVMRHFIESCDQIAALDLVIANAGISNSGRKTNEMLDREIFATNLDGVLNTIYPTIDLMEKRRSGQIAIISSLASLHGFARATSYCASKAAVTTLGQALRSRLKKQGIKISVICPGFVATPLIANSLYSKPLVMSAEKSARIIVHGLNKNKAMIAFPRRLYFLICLFRALPSKIKDMLV